MREQAKEMRMVAIMTTNDATGQASASGHNGSGLITK